MWQKISLRYRLNLLFGVLLALWLAVDVGRILADARPRARAEAESMTRLTSEFVAMALPHLREAPDPERALAALVENLQNLRHVRVALSRNDGLAVVGAFTGSAEARSQAPAWLTALVRAPVGVTTIPVNVGGRRMGSIVIVGDPLDEIGEVWAAAKTQALAGGALALALLGASSLFLRRALKPLDVAGRTLARLESGDYAARATPSGSPEFVDTCGKINSLAQTLAELSAAKADLIEKLIDLQDEERKAIAHELHDEIGPHLFALRAGAALLAARLQAGGDPAAEAAAVSLRDQVEALQGQNRRILARLRPAALEEFGLIDALEILAEQWRKAQPGVALALSSSAGIAALGERASLMAYRFVQEGLTNAFRHAGARRIDVTLDYEPAGRDFEPTGRGAKASDPALTGLRIRIRDDGRGVGEEATPSMGFLGMRERVQALGGEVVISNAPEGGAVVEAIFAAQTRPGSA
ncbi:histidine kinase [uncultured Rhodoblastus sp.]|uniref:histidine kinase n=1 Tax=uncultured Rhodoblastus sp. TaxID=543037 RepID=UPI0025F38E4A|nr:histidine kinase [uncultured Rhodoblastus sp.]